MTKYKVTICIPTYGTIFAEQLEQFIMLGRWAEKHSFPLLTVSNRTHVDARNWLATGGAGFSASSILSDHTENLLWIDSDMQFTESDLDRLVEHTHPFVSGVYKKGNRIMAAHWNEAKFNETGKMDFLTQEDIDEARGKPINVSYVGFGFCKTDMSLFEKMSYPYFRNKMVTIKYKDKHVTENVSEDASFCLDCSVKPILDTKIKLGHLKVGTIL